PPEFVQIQNFARYLAGRNTEYGAHKPWKERNRDPIHLSAQVQQRWCRPRTDDLYRCAGLARILASCDVGKVEDEPIRPLGHDSLDDFTVSRKDLLVGEDLLDRPTKF